MLAIYHVTQLHTPELHLVMNLLSNLFLGETVSEFCIWGNVSFPLVYISSKLSPPIRLHDLSLSFLIIMYISGFLSTWIFLYSVRQIVPPLHCPIIVICNGCFTEYISCDKHCNLNLVTLLNMKIINYVTIKYIQPFCFDWLRVLTMHDTPTCSEKRMDGENETLNHFARTTMTHHP